MKNRKKLIPFFFCFINIFAFHISHTEAETIYVNIQKGNDSNPGTKSRPLRTFNQAAIMVNSSTERGPTLIKIAPGIYHLDKTVAIKNNRHYTEKSRLIIEAKILPDDPDWKPANMPIIFSTEFPQQQSSADKIVEVSGLKIEINHVTICGLKFLGSPVPNILYYPIFREGKNLTDLIVTQCLFSNDAYTLSSNVAILANGHRLIVDHCIFYNCSNPVVFWRAEDDISKGNIMRYCLVDGAYISSIWVCDTGDDLEFHHNLITGSEYVWMRDEDNKRTYHLHDCIITDYQYYSGNSDPNFKLSPTSPEIVFEENNVIKKGKVTLEKGKGFDLGVPMNFLHVTPGTFGSELGAGLFKRKK